MMTESGVVGVAIFVSRGGFGCTKRTNRKKKRKKNNSCCDPEPICVLGG